MFLQEPDRWYLGSMDTVIDIQTTDQHLKFLIYTQNHPPVQFSPWMIVSITFPCDWARQSNLLFFSWVNTAPQAYAQSIYSTGLVLKQRWVSATILSLGQIHVGTPEVVLNQLGTQWSTIVGPELRLCHSLFSPALQELKTPSHPCPELSSAEVTCWAVPRITNLKLLPLQHATSSPCRGCVMQIFHKNLSIILSMCV